MFGARLMNANLEFHRKNIGKNHQTAGHELKLKKDHHVRVTAALLQLQFMFFHDEWMEWVDLANIRTWRVREYRLKLFDYDAKAFHSFTSCHYK